jgi:hypothetical protein
MKNLHDLLRQKETAVKRLEKDIEAIRNVMAMLTEEPEQPTNGEPKQVVNAPAVSLASAVSTGGTYSAVSQNARPDPPKISREWP